MAGKLALILINSVCVLLVVPPTAPSAWANDVPASGAAPHLATALNHLTLLEFGEPVTVGGIHVRTGDLIHADQHGVQIVPPEIARALPAACEKIIEKERKIIVFCQSEAFSLDGLKKLVP